MKLKTLLALADALHVSAVLLLYQESQNAQIQTLALMLEGQSPEFVDGIIELVRTCIANFDSKEDKILLICEDCYEKGEFPNGLDENSFELSNVFNILMPNEKLTMKLQSKLEKDQWSIEETKKLLEAIDKYDDKWDEIAKVFEGKRTKADIFKRSPAAITVDSFLEKHLAKSYLNIIDKEKIITPKQKLQICDNLP